MEGQEDQGTNTVVNTNTTTNTGAVTQPVGTQAQTKTEGTVTQTVNKTEGNEGTKIFTQEEVNALLAKEKKNLPSKEELKAFKDWQESQKTEEQKRQEEVVRMQNLQNDNNSQSQIISIMRNGIDYETAEFIQFKLSKMDGDFDTNLETYLAENKNKFTKEETKKPVTTGFSQSKTNTSTNTNKDYLDRKYADNPYYKK